MRAKRSIAIGGLAATLVGGGAALAARNSDDPDKVEQAILADAAKRLGVSTGDLEDALAKAEDAQLDRAVEDGTLTKEQANAIKKRRAESGRVLGGVPGPRPGFGFGFHGPGRSFHVDGGPLEDVADALGISVRKLFAELRGGKTLEQIAKAHGKSIGEVRDAVRKAAEKRLDEAVEDGKLTKKQADELREHLDVRLDHLGELPRRPPRFAPPHLDPPPGGGERFWP